MEDANKAVKQGLMQIGWGDWEFDTCKEITDSGVIE